MFLCMFKSQVHDSLVTLLSCMKRVQHPSLRVYCHIVFVEGRIQIGELIMNGDTLKLEGPAPFINTLRDMPVIFKKITLFGQQIFHLV